MIRSTIARVSARGFVAMLGAILLLIVGGLVALDRTLAPIPEARTLRLALWVIGLVVAGLLGVLLIHERRQTIRISERSTELERLYSEVARANTAKSEF